MRYRRNKNNLVAFINYNYIPFSKSQCIKRLVTIWLLSIGVSLVGTHTIIWSLVFSVINIVVSIIFIVLILKFSLSKIARFLCDGITFLYIAIILNLGSYKFLTLLVEENWMLCLIFLSFLLMDITIFTIVVYKNIKSNKYSAQSNSKKVIWLPFVSTTCGILASRFFLQDASQETNIILVSTILLFLSFITGIPSINLLKAFLLNKLEIE